MAIVPGPASIPKEGWPTRRDRVTDQQMEILGTAPPPADPGHDPILQRVTDLAIEILGYVHVEDLGDGPNFGGGTILKFKIASTQQAIEVLGFSQ